MTPADVVECSNEIDRIELDSIHRSRRSIDETDRDRLGFIGRILRRGGQHEQICRWGSRCLFEDAALVGDVPDITVRRVDFVSRRGHGNLTRLGVSDRILAAGNAPLPPWGNNREVWRKRSIGQLKADLIVSFAGAAVGKGIGADAPSDLNLPACDERTTHRGAEEVLATVDSSSAEGGPHELFHELLTQIFDVALIGTRGERFSADALQLFTLADIRGDADNTRAVAFLEPRDDDGRIEPPGIGEGYSADHRASISIQDN